MPGGVLAQTLAGHLVHEITVRGAQGGPLTPLADQLNHDMTHLQGERLEGMLAQVISMVTDTGPGGPRPAGAEETGAAGAAAGACWPGGRSCWSIWTPS